MYDNYMGFFNLPQRGQALIEYLLVLVLIMILASKLALGFTDFMRDSIGNLGHVISLHLSVGTCREQCFFDAYKNGVQ